MNNVNNNLVKHDLEISHNFDSKNSKVLVYTHNKKAGTF